MQGAGVQAAFLFGKVADVVGMGIEPIDLKYGGILEPLQIRCHNAILLIINSGKSIQYIHINR